MSAHSEVAKNLWSTAAYFSQNTFCVGC